MGYALVVPVSGLLWDSVIDYHILVSPLTKFKGTGGSVPLWLQVRGEDSRRGVAKAEVTGFSGLHSIPDGLWLFAGADYFPSVGTTPLVPNVAMELHHR